MILRSVLIVTTPYNVKCVRVVCVCVDGVGIRRTHIHILTPPTHTSYTYNSPTFDLCVYSV